MLGLPLLDVFLNENGTALADGTRLPLRFGTWFFAAGVMEGWQPGSTGDLVIPSGFGPLEEHRDYIGMVSGLACPSFGDYSTNRHIMGAAAQLTGHPPQGGAMTARSIDQVAADILDDAPRRAVHVGVTGNGSGESGTGWHAISHNGANNPNPPQLDPRKVYEDLFSLEQPGDGGFSRAPHRLSYLDACREDIQDLRGQLGARDRQALDAYLEGISEIESSIDALDDLEACNASPELVADVNDGMIDAPSHATAINRTMARLVATALQCGVTRVFSFQFMEQNSFKNLNGGGTDHHNLGHAQAPALYDSVANIMAHFADLLTELRNIPEGDGTLLDNVAVLAMTETAWEHRMDNMLGLYAGRSGGALRTGVHVATGGTHSRLSQTLLSTLGVTEPFGTGDANTTELINGILA